MDDAPTNPGYAKLHDFVRDAIVTVYGNTEHGPRIEKPDTAESRAVTETTKLLGSFMEVTGVSKVKYHGNGDYSQLTADYQLRADICISHMDRADVLEKGGINAVRDQVAKVARAELKEGSHPVISIVEHSYDSMFKIYDVKLVEAEREIAKAKEAAQKATNFSIAPIEYDAGTVHQAQKATDGKRIAAELVK